MDSITIFALAIDAGDVAQLVEQRTENPCVGGSIPSITTPTKQKKPFLNRDGFFALRQVPHSPLRTGFICNPPYIFIPCLTIFIHLFRSSPC